MWSWTPDAISSVLGGTCRWWAGLSPTRERGGVVCGHAIDTNRDAGRRVVDAGLEDGIHPQS